MSIAFTLPKFACKVYYYVDTYLFPMSLTDHLPIKATSHFTAIKGAGPAAHNLEVQLHRASMSSSSGLHALKEHVGTIAGVFNKSFVKQAIRQGGLSSGEQKLVVKHILEANPKIGQSTLKKNLIRQVVKHFGKEGSAAKPQTKVAAPHYFRRPEPEPDPNHATSINQMMHSTESTSAFNVTEKRTSTVVKNKTYGGVGNMIDAKKIGPTPPPKKSFTPPRLAV